MTDGISTSPHCLYKSNIVDDVIINKTRQNELVKVFCEYKTEFLILFDDFFRSHNLPKHLQSFIIFFNILIWEMHIFIDVNS